jgi:hypothetical protein
MPPSQHDAPEFLRLKARLIRSAITVRRAGITEYNMEQYISIIDALTRSTPSKPDRRSS